MTTPLVIKFNGERTSDDRCLKFDVKWMDGDSTKEPIYSFIDFSKKEITESFTYIAKNIYKTYSGNKCWFCSKHVCLNNNCVCEHHYKKCDWFIEHFNNLLLDDFNSSELVLELNDEPNSPSGPNGPNIPTSPPRLRRLSGFIRSNNVSMPRHINFETDDINNLPPPPSPILESQEDYNDYDFADIPPPAPPRLRRGDYEKLEDDYHIFTMI